MNKYILDEIRNNSRRLLRDLTVPQQKAVSEVIRGLFTAKQPILRHLAQNADLTAKKQAEKYSHHLGNVNLREKVEAAALSKVRHVMRKDTIIAYDLSDIAKEASKKMAKLSQVFDGSKREVTNGYTLHGVGINSLLLKFEVHDGEINTQNQTRRRIIEELNVELGGKGIWVFDRGNDDKGFFSFLRHFVKAQFICRLRSNRQIVMKETGAIMKVSELPVGQHTVYLMNKYNTHVDTRAKYTLVISNHLEAKQPIRLLASLRNDYSSKQIVHMYLKRWGIENTFKRTKQKFNLEKIRVLDYQKFVNLVALVQFAVNVCTIMFAKIQKLTYSLISGVLIYYKRFIHKKSLTFNLDSFISYIQFSLKPKIMYPKRGHPKQKPLFTRRLLVKLGSF